MDNRIKKLADVLVHYSCNIQKGERVLISYDGETAKPLVKQIIKGEAPQVKVSGKLPFTEQITAPVMFKIKLEDPLITEARKYNSIKDFSTKYLEAEVKKLETYVLKQVIDILKNSHRIKSKIFEECLSKIFALFAVKLKNMYLHTHKPYLCKLT